MMGVPRFNRHHRFIIPHYVFKSMLVNKGLWQGPIEYHVLRYDKTRTISILLIWLLYKCVQSFILIIHCNTLHIVTISAKYSKCSSNTNFLKMPCAQCSIDRLCNSNSTAKNVLWIMRPMVKFVNESSEGAQSCSQFLSCVQFSGKYNSYHAILMQSISE